MSAQVLQRVVARMLFDPGWRAEVLRSPESALHGLTLTSSERRWLLEPDPRRWGADGERRQRSLEAMMHESLLSTASFISLKHHPRDLLSFFSSPLAHRAIQSGDRLLYAYLRWIAAALPRESRWIPELETALALARWWSKHRPLVDPVKRPSSVALSRAHFSLSPAVSLVQHPAEGATLFQTQLARIQQEATPLLTVLQGIYWSGTLDGDSVEYSLIAPRPESPHWETLPEGLARLLKTVEGSGARGRRGADLLRRLRSAGLDRGEAERVLSSLYQENLLTLMRASSSQKSQSRS
ncbi:MAG: hypothetical protein VYD19_05210 [Myxococcota bacterium]|nr:hypothetical protein [Myxococcota bacterium]